MWLPLAEERQHATTKKSFVRHNKIALDVRTGSGADIEAHSSDVRFTTKADIAERD